MSLIASRVSTRCLTHVWPPSSVRLRNPPSPATHPRLLSRKYALFRSVVGASTLTVAQPCCVWLLVVLTPTRTDRMQTKSAAVAKAGFMITFFIGAVETPGVDVLISCLYCRGRSTLYPKFQT